MSEALQAILDFACQEMAVKRVEAHIYVENQRSIALVENFGFAVTGEKYEHFRGDKLLHHVCSLLLQ